MAPQSEPEALDEIDRRLLAALQEDGRLGYAELGELVGLTSGGARKRVIRLKEQGVVQIVGVTDPLTLGYNCMAMVGVTASGDVTEIASALGDLPSVVYVVLTAGRFDLLVEVVAPDQSALFDVINDEIRSIDRVLQVETFPYFSIQTHRFAWGT